MGWVLMLLLSLVNKRVEKCAKFHRWHDADVWDWRGRME
jgi:hypothetical protein